MDDGMIVALYWQRSETAISQSQVKYGAYCRSIADAILRSAPDAEECVNDTWLGAWNSIPPKKPNRLAVFLGRITRNLAIDRYRHNHALRRGSGELPLCLDELGECIGEDSPVEDRYELKCLLDIFLGDLGKRSREIFLLRYWYCMPVLQIASQYGLSEGAVKMNLKRTRDKLRTYFDKEGIGI